MKVAITELVLPTLPIPEFFKTIKAAGYESAELALRTAPDAPFNYSTTDADLMGFKKAAADTGISIDSITIANTSGNLHMAPADAKGAIDETIWGLECAAKLGAPVALHTLGAYTDDIPYDEAYCNSIANLKTLAKSCKKIGVAIAVEFIWTGFLFSPLEMRNMLSAVNCPDEIGFYFDSGNMCIFQYPQHWAHVLGPQIKRVHLKDFAGGPGNATWPGLLKGRVNFPAVMAELKNAGYDGPLTSEVSTNDASIEETAQAIRKIMQMG